MNEEKNCVWASYYMAFADALLMYKNDRKELLRITRDIYKELDMRYPFIDNGTELEDICPFTIMGCFNKGINNENRIAIMHAFSEKLGISVPVPNEFEGIPVLNNLKAWFFRYREQRKPSDIPNLWEVFENAIYFADKPSEGNKAQFIDSYNKVIKQGCISWNITMGLFWIRPYFYLNLDSRNREYLVVSELSENKMLRSLPEANAYLELIERCKDAFANSKNIYHSFPELSRKAWVAAEEGDNKFSRWMIPLVFALRELGGAATPKEARDRISSDLELSDAALNEVRGKSGINKFSNEVAWARQYLVYADIISNEKRAIWKLTEKGKNIELTPGMIDEIVKDGRKKAAKAKKEVEEEEEVELAGEVREEEEVFDYEIYREEDFLEDVFIDKESYEALITLLEKKKNVILEGAPGVGKTFIAKRLAYSIMGMKNSEHVKMVQFHQSYSYEDFVMGYRPNDTGFELKAGPFYEFCKKAEENPGGNYYFIIDEINRGNMSKIFGELLMLIEADKRGLHLDLLYSDDKIPRSFSVPKNLYIIGMMNTADRSLAMIDYALRRRFAFYPIRPAFESEGFEKIIRLADNNKFNELINMVKKLNKEIAEDEALGEGFMIGHSYFCTEKKIEDVWLRSIVEYEIIPLIKEYWFDDNEKVIEWSKKLRGVVND